MELKCKRTGNTFTGLICLLIVPYGIEMITILLDQSKFKLLIVPYGIEMTK